MIDALIPWLAAAFALVWAYPWARWLARQDRALTGLLTIGLSLGGLAWIMLILAAISPGLVACGPVTAIAALASGAGWWTLRRQGGAPRDSTPPDPDARHPLRVTTLLVIAALVALALFNAAYWPYGEDDALTLYAPMAYRIAMTGQFGAAGGAYDIGLYNAYPQLNPLVTAYLQLAAGAPHEYAGRFIMAALGLALVGAAYVLGRDLFSARVGLAAAYLVAATPVLVHWASAAYTDLPAGTYYTLAMVFAWRLARRPSGRDALLAGLLAGLAAFTKNGALLIIPALAGWVVYTQWAARRDPGGALRAVSLRHAALLAGGFLLAAGPWYGHTLLAYGTLVPSTGWTEQATRTLAALLGPALAPGQYMAGGILAVIGLGWGVIRLGRVRPALLLGFSVPFWLVWWALFSYDLRFLLLVWGVCAVLGADALLAAWDAVTPRMTPPRWIGRAALPALIVALALPAMRMAVDHKPALLRDPFMDDAARHVQQLGERWRLQAWVVEQAPAGASVLLADYKLYYGLLLSPLTPVLSDHFEREFVLRHDYWIASPWQGAPDWITAAGLQVLTAAEGYTLYAVP